MGIFRRLVVALLAVTLAGGCTYKSAVTFPSPEEVFITSGDGEITKPYTPVGEFLLIKEGYRIPLPLLGMVDLLAIDPDQVVRTEVAQEIRRMGGDGLINMRIVWDPSDSGLFGLFARGGSLAVTGTVIRR